MARSRSLVALAGVAIVGLAGVGLGAGASFTDAVSTTQTITAGRMSLTITDSAGTVSADGKSVVLPAFGPVGSTFLTTNRIITVTNTGTVQATPLAFQMSETHPNTGASNALAAQMNVCIQSTDVSGGPWTEGNGPLSTAVAITPTVSQNVNFLQPGASMTYSVDFYAGQDSTCRPTASDGSTTRARWENVSGAYQTPASLTNAAMGGVVTPTLAFSFSD